MPQPSHEKPSPTGHEGSTPAAVLIDQRGIPTHQCLCCGSNVFLVRATFEDYDIAAWFLDAACAECNCPITAPCPADDPGEQP